jgi:hypothetical protein
VAFVFVSGVWSLLLASARVKQLMDEGDEQFAEVWLPLVTPWVRTVADMTPP